MKRKKKRGRNVFSRAVSLFAKDFGLKCLSLVLATAIYLALAPDYGGTDRVADSARNMADGIAVGVDRHARAAVRETVDSGKTGVPESGASREHSAGNETAENPIGE